MVVQRGVRTPTCNQSAQKNSGYVTANKEFNIAKNLKYEYQRGLASLVYNFFNKMSSATRTNKFTGSSLKTELVSDQELAKE